MAIGNHTLNLENVNANALAKRRAVDYCNATFNTETPMAP